ncbi:MAG: GDSL-type esterase/lipase family protein [Pseudomonadota bacterium]
MKTVAKVLGVLLGLLILVAAWPAYQLYGELQKAASEDPLVWEEDIAALEVASRGRFAPDEAIVFVGSSSIRLWDTLPQDMAPLPVLQHGFGGAKMHDVVHYADRLVGAFAPRAVVMFAGTNDVHPGSVKSPQTLLASYQAFVEAVRRDRPELPIFFIEITPSPLRWTVWEDAAAANRLIAQWSATQSGLTVIDTSVGLMGEDGQPDPDNYLFDGLHLSEQGYDHWARVIRSALQTGLAPPNG